MAVVAQWCGQAFAAQFEWEPVIIVSMNDLGFLSASAATLHHRGVHGPEC